MKIISLLSILTVFQLQHSSFTHGSEATIDAASGETIIIADADAEPTPTCQPKDLLNGKLSSCDTFQIATLNASPRRCIHIEAQSSSPSSSSNDDKNILVCTNYANWFDGTNTCNAYHQPNYCDKYGHTSYSTSQYTASQACCACNGGTHAPPRLQVGEYVKLTGYGPYDECELLMIVELVTIPQNFHYVVQTTKPCGPMQHVRDARGMISVQHSFQPGMKLSVTSDEPSVIAKLTRVELKKCRRGKEEQEFILKPIEVVENEGGSSNHVVVIQHRLTGVELATALGSKSPFFGISQVFEDDLFEGSGDFYFLRVASERIKGTPRGPAHAYLASGHFGEKEYSMVKTKALLMSRGFDEQEFSMWKFQPVTKDETDDTSAAVDEHAQWLMRMTQLIGIDYLQQLPPWHLLDVERDASKSDVKSRFRELSRSFHPDKQAHQTEKKKDLFERIFVLLQNAYQGLKSADEQEKEKFRVEADSGSQLFAHSQYVVELLPFHWTKLENTTEEGIESSNSRYILNAASHLNSTLLDTTSAEEEEEVEPSVQIWVTFMYSARCGMSRSVVGMIDLAARHLEQHENIKVGAYGCGLYKEYPMKKNDPTGVTSDPICAQFQRRETPNVHVIVETIPGRKRDENGELVEVHPDLEIVQENAQFKYLYAAVPHGNTTQFYPHNFVNFAKAGKRVWQNNHLVHRMKRKDFFDPHFLGNISIVAYMDGTGLGETDNEVVDAISNSLPGFARRFLNDDLYIGIAQCGFGDDENDAESKKNVDCSKLGVSWLPDIKVYGVNDMEGVSLLRGQFSDMRDVQIALESMGNTLRMMLGGTDNDFEDEFEEIQDIDDAEEGEGGCDSNQPPPPPHDLEDLDEIEGRMEDTPLLEMETEEEASETNPELDTESKPALDQSTEKSPRKPKLASSDMPQLAGVRENKARDRMSGFHKRETKRAGGGKILGGGGSGSAGFIT